MIAAVRPTSASSRSGTPAPRSDSASSPLVRLHVHHRMNRTATNLSSESRRASRRVRRRPEHFRDRVGADRARPEDARMSAGEVDDRGGRLLFRRPGVEIDLDEVTELVAGVVDGDRRGLAGDVGAGHRHRTYLAQHLDRHRVQRHPQHHGARRIAEIPLQRRRLLDNEAQRAGPERADQFPGGVRHRVHQAFDGVPGPDEHRDGHVAAAALRRQQRRDRGAVEGVSADAVDGVGGQHDEASALDRADRRGDSRRARLGVGAVEHGAHCPMLRIWARTLPTRSGLARQSGAIALSFRA